MPSIYTAKEQLIADTPLLLFDCTFPNGIIGNWSTHTAIVNGTKYLPWVLKQNVFEMQMGSDLGVDMIPQITIDLANASSFFSEIERSVGVKGSQITVSIVFFSFANQAPSSDVQVLFKGILDPPQQTTETVFRVSATNRLSLQRVLLPDTRIQKRCPWTFPTSASQRAEAVFGRRAGAVFTILPLRLFSRPDRRRGKSAGGRDRLFKLRLYAKRLHDAGHVQRGRSGPDHGAIWRD